MKLRVEDIHESGRSLDFREEVGPLNETLTDSDPAAFRFEKPAHVTLSYYRCGQDLFFEGNVTAALWGTCARCVERFRFGMDRGFRFVLKPATGGESLPDEDGAIGFYTGDEIDLTPRLHEEMILGLPTRPLCTEDCPGLCSRCGKNRREGACDCEDEWLDPRLAPLRNLKVRH